MSRIRQFMLPRDVLDPTWQDVGATLQGVTLAGQPRELRLEYDMDHDRWVVILREETNDGW